jgi:cobalt-zinc-cadmium efflux system protein
MFVVASIGLIANGVAILLLHRSKDKNLNIRSAYLHLLGDTFSSVAVITGGILIYFFNWFWVDPLLTVIISLYILFETWKILRQTYDILMQGTPSGLDITSIAEDLEKLVEVHDIHHIHAWNLDDQSIHFECHVDLMENLNLEEVEKIRNKIKVILEEKYHIDHITIQFEHKWCHDRNHLSD